MIAEALSPGRKVCAVFFNKVARFQADSKNDWFMRH